MIKLFFDTTPNGRKILIALEELHIPYELIWLRLDRGEQHQTAYKKLSPSGTMPAIIDTRKPLEPRVIFESGAILLYLANQFGALLPKHSEAKQHALNWLFWQTSTFGPNVGQATHFMSYAPAKGIVNTYSQKRYLCIVQQLYAVLNNALRHQSYIAGEEYTIADIAIYPWVSVAKGHGIDLSCYPNVKAWKEQISQRPATRVKPKLQGRLTPFTTYQAADPQVWQNLFHG